MSWHYLPELEAEYLGENSWVGEPCAPLKSTPSVGKFCLDASWMDAYRASLSGTMCELSTGSRGVDLSMSSQEASPAKIYPVLVKVRESTAREAASGRSSLESFAKYDPNTHSWKTRQRSLLVDYTEYSGTWPRWGIMRDGECWELCTSAPRTGEIGSGLSLPTPCATDGDRGGRGDLIQAIRGNPNKHFRFPTPRANKWGLPDSHGSVKAWATPRSIPNENRQMKPTPSQLAGKHGSSLAAQVGGPLNPDWIEWLMGWPIRWTALGPLEMDKFRQWLASHGKH